MKCLRFWNISRSIIKYVQFCDSDHVNKNTFHISMTHNFHKMLIKQLNKSIVIRFIQYTHNHLLCHPRNEIIF